MPDELVNVRYMVDDVEDAVDFYTNLLGFEVLTNVAPAFADVARGNLRLLLSGPASSAGRPMPDGRKPEPGRLEPHPLHRRRHRGRGRAPARRRRDVPQRHRHGPGGRQILLEDPSGNGSSCSSRRARSSHGATPAGAWDCDRASGRNPTRTAQATPIPSSGAGARKGDATASGRGDPGHR